MLGKGYIRYQQQQMYGTKIKTIRKQKSLKRKFNGPSVANALPSYDYGHMSLDDSQIHMPACIAYYRGCKRMSSVSP